MSVDFDNDLLLITAASGKQGSGILPNVSRWKRLRLQCVSDSSKNRLQEAYPHAEVVQSQFTDSVSATKLLEGVSACVLNLPAFHPRETQYGLNMIDAADQQIANGGPFKHMVFSSVIHPEISAMINHDSKRYVEEAFVESGLNYTIVQPTQLMDNVPIKSLVSQPSPVFHARFNPEVAFSFVNVHDLGQGIAKILDQREKHYFGTYQFVSTPKPLNFVEAMQIVSEECGQTVKVVQDSLEDTLKTFSNAYNWSALPVKERQALERGYSRMLVFYESQGLLGSCFVLETLLGRKTLGYREWVRKQLQ